MNTNINIDNSDIGDNNNIGNTYFITLLKKFNNNGLDLLTSDFFDRYVSNERNLENWKRGFDFELQDIKSNKHYKRTDLTNKILDELEDQNALLITGIQGVGKTTTLMDLTCELFDKGKTVLYNFDNSDFPVFSELIDWFEELLQNDDELYVIVDNVHLPNMSIIFHLWDKLSSHVKAKNVKFLLSARQPEYDKLVHNKLYLVDLEKHRESIRKFNLRPERMIKIPIFSVSEIREFLLTYLEVGQVHFELKESEVPVIDNPENPDGLYIFLEKVTGGLPIYLKYFAFNQNDGIIQDIQRIVERHLYSTDNLEAYIISAILDISDIRITDDLMHTLSIEKEVHELLDIVIKKKSDNAYSTMHSIWNLLFFEYVSQKNELYMRVNIFKRVFERIANTSIERDVIKTLQTIYMYYKKFHLTPEILEKSFVLPATLSNESRCFALGTFMISPFRENRVLDKVIDLCEKALELDSNFIPALINKSAAHNDLKQYSLALLTSQRILNLDISNVSGWINKGLALGGLKDHSHALCCLEKALQINPMNAETWYNKGNIYFKMGLYRLAINCYDKCQDLDPRHVHSFVNKGVTLFEMRDYNSAIDSFEGAEKLDPTNLNCKNGKGLCYFEQGRMDDALIIFDCVILKDPYYVEAWRNKIDCLRIVEPKNISKAIQDAMKYGLKI